MARLPLLARIAVSLIIPVIFVVVTQWERLTAFRLNLEPKQPVASISLPPPNYGFNNFSSQSPTDKGKAEVDAALANRLASFEIVDPIVQANGSITGSRKTLYLYGIKKFDSKKVCTRALGERWACGLHAFATLRNNIAKRTIVCDPKTVSSPDAISAICRIGTTNVALAIVREGLVELDDNADDAELIEAQNIAKSKKLGIWDR